MAKDCAYTIIHAVDRVIVLSKLPSHLRQVVRLGWNEDILARKQAIRNLSIVISLYVSKTTMVGNIPMRTKKPYSLEKGVVFTFCGLHEGP
jgi:hypothetical protein